MKHIKTFESKYPHEKFDKYLLIKTIVNNIPYVIVKVLGSRVDKHDKSVVIEMRKLYDINKEGEIWDVARFFFSQDEEKINEYMLYQSNDIDEVLKHVDIILDS